MSTAWAYRERARIEALLNADLIIEVHNAMNGRTYSWRSIGRILRHPNIDYRLYRQWNDLCNLKQTWDSIPSLTKERQHKDVAQRLSRDLSRQTWDLNHLRTLLISLKLIPIRAGLEEEQAIRLVSQNLDEPSKGALEDLWVPCEKSTFFVNGPWDLEHGIDEETPLLAYKANNQKSTWFWRKWLSWI